MRKIISYIAISLNGQIADAQGEVAWLDAVPNPDKLDYGYQEFYETIDTTIMGYKTYKQVIDWGVEFPYKDKTNYVLTSSKKEAAEYVKFISENHIDFIQKLKESAGKDIWLIGGGQVNTFALNSKFLDELMIYLMPVVIAKGINLFELLPQETNLELIDSKSYPTGVQMLKYKL